MNWSDLKIELRIELDDSGATPKWDDATLFTYLREALADYSQYFPLVSEVAALTVSLTNPLKYCLPTDFLEENQVQSPAGNILELRRGRSGSRLSSGEHPLFYYVDGTFLFLDANPGSSAVLMTYDAIHSMPANMTDDAFVLSVPSVDIELIKLYIVGKVNTRQRNAQSRLDRFKLGTGTREDNPMRMETEDFFARYYQKIAERMRPEAKYLQRPRRYR